MKTMISGTWKCFMVGIVNGHVRLRINEDVSAAEMGIYRHISAGLLRFIQGAFSEKLARGMRLVQYSTHTHTCARSQTPALVLSYFTSSSYHQHHHQYHYYLKSKYQIFI